MSEYFEVGLLKEPKVEFGNDFVCDDPKAGIAIGGFFSNSNRSHKREINIAIIGTPRLVTDTLRWIQQFDSRVTAKEVALKQLDATIEDGEIVEDDDYYFAGFDDANLADFDDVQARKVTNKKLNPDFLGFNNGTPFDCVFQNNPANNREIKEREYDIILGNPDLSDVERQEHLIDVIKTRFIDLIENKTSSVDVCLIVLPDSVFKKVHSVRFGKSHSNFRRKLKAELIATDNTIPTQIIIEGTIKGTKRSMQDLSMTAWNFCVASYYKAGCIPWALQVRESDTCFIGISFSKAITHENDTMRSSIAQAFNREGQGLVFTWKSFSWDSDANRTRAPHLEHGYAKELISHVLDEYEKINSHSPSRVVIHKTTDFWSEADSIQFNELGGLRDGILEKLGPSATIDFVTIKTSPIKILRSFGRYPVPRGTILKLNSSERVLYTTGYIPYFELYPGTHIPHPLIIKCAESDSHIDKICEEILALTKLNFNNCSYYDSLPITIRFSKKVGEIIQYLPKEAKPQNKYYFYM
jgi:hypothetical protein